MAKKKAVKRKPKCPKKGYKFGPKGVYTVKKGKRVNCRKMFPKTRKVVKVTNPEVRISEIETELARFNVTQNPPIFLQKGAPAKPIAELELGPQRKPVSLQTPLDLSNEKFVQRRIN